MFLKDLPADIQAIEEQCPPVAENAIAIATERYLVKEKNAEGKAVPVEDIYGMYYRVAKTMAEASQGDTDQTAIYYKLLRCSFLPNSPCLANAGARTGQLSACFVLPVPDDLEGIYQAIKEAQLIQQTGGGVGFDFSRLRRKDGLVHTSHGKASGPLSFINVFDTACSALKQGGMRRGAQMGILRVDHPDILAFIEAKQDLERWKNFNVSVAITDAFLEAWEANADYELVDPKAGPTGEFLSTKVVMDLIVDRAWRTGEPGLILIDRMNKYNPNVELGLYEATNPCFAPGTLVLTREGVFPIEELVGKTVEVWDGNAWVSCDNFRVTAEDQIVYEVKLASGDAIVATANHKFILEDGSRVTLAELEPGDRLMTHDKTVEDGYVRLPAAYLCGFLLGDGAPQRDGVQLQVYQEKYDACADRLQASFAELGVGKITFNPCLEGNRYNVGGIGAGSEALAPWAHEYKEGLPTWVHNLHPHDLAELVAGYFDADGTAISSNGFGYQASSVKEQFLVDLNRVLLRFGVRGRVHLTKPGGMKDFGARGGVCVVQPLYRLFLSQGPAKKLAQHVSFSRLKDFSDSPIKGVRKLRTHTVTSVTEIGMESKVYCCTIESTHSFALANGVQIGNCGEQSLVPYESCNLGSLNLESYVKKSPYTGEFYFDFRALAADTHHAVAFMDASIDINKFSDKVPQLREVALMTRKLGLGFMGAAHALIALGIPYDSQEGRDYLSSIFAFIDAAAHCASLELAQKHGPSPYQVAHPEEADAFNRRVIQERVVYLELMLLRLNGSGAHHSQTDAVHRALNLYRGLLRREGHLLLRNSTLTTLAPTGTISIFHNTSGGCEPVYSLVITRFQAGLQLQELNPALLERLQRAGFSEAEQNAVLDVLRDPKVEGSLNIALEAGHFDEHGQKHLLKELAAFIRVTADVSPSDHVLMQAALQVFCDSSISKTINLPEHARREDVEEAYRLAVKTGCKGITVYRNNCRQFQPLQVGAVDGTKKAEKVEEPKPEKSFEEQVRDNRPTIQERRKRDAVLYGFTQRLETGEGRLYINVNYDGEGIREVIATVGKSGGTLHAMAEGLSRIVSLALQHHVPVSDIVHQLANIQGGEPRGFGPNRVVSIPDAISKVMREAPTFFTAPALPTIDDSDPFSDDEEAKAIREAFTEEDEAEYQADLRQMALEMGHSPQCPNCSAPMVFGREGCRGGTCSNASCGYQKCS